MDSKVSVKGTKSTCSKVFVLGTCYETLLNPMLLSVLMHRLLGDIPQKGKYSIICYKKKINPPTIHFPNFPIDTRYIRVAANNTEFKKRGHLGLFLKCSSNYTKATFSIRRPENPSTLQSSKGNEIKLNEAWPTIVIHSQPDSCK